MKRFIFLAIMTYITLFNGPLFAENTDLPAPSPNGIAFPVGYQNWQVIACSYRKDNDTLRIILGNEVAIKAARAGVTTPWPDKAILAKLVWKTRQDENWAAAIVPDAFVHAEFMFKDTQKYAKTNGWGWARWLGSEQKPYGKDDDFAQECIDCHTPVKSRDYVFTTPAILPKIVE